KNCKEVLEQCLINLQIRRKLKQHRAELTSSRQRLNGRQKSRNKVLRRLEALDVRDDLVRLYAEAKLCGRVLQPVLDGRFFNKLPESEIHFDRIQLRRVVSQELLLRQLGRIKIRLPCRVGPARGSNKQLRHKMHSRSSIGWPILAAFCAARVGIS